LRDCIGKDSARFIGDDVQQGERIGVRITGFFGGPFDVEENVNDPRGGGDNGAKRPSSSSCTISAI
jgi:hypothetical protein